MARLTAMALTLPLVLAAPAAAQIVDQDGTAALTSSSRLAGEAPLQIERRGFSFPIIEYTEPSGAIKQRRGIIAGAEVAPGTLVGIGLFETMPKARGFAPDPTVDGGVKRKRRAAVGLTVRF